MAATAACPLSQSDKSCCWSAQVFSNKQIAQRLDVTKGTVEVHLHNIYVKFAMPNRTMLALLALHLGVTAPTIESNI